MPSTMCHVHKTCVGLSVLLKPHMSGQSKSKIPIRTSHNKNMKHYWTNRFYPTLKEKGHRRISILLPNIIWKIINSIFWSFSWLWCLSWHTSSAYLKQKFAHLEYLISPLSPQWGFVFFIISMYLCPVVCNLVTSYPAILCYTCVYIG